MVEFSVVVDLQYPIEVACDGTSMWADTRGWKGKVTEIRVLGYRNDDYTSVYLEVHHTFPSWEIYTDEGFEKAISEILGVHLDDSVEVTFTEQGMQAWGIASMEPMTDAAEEALWRLG